MHSLFLALTLLTTVITVNGDELIPSRSSSISLKGSSFGQYLSNISIEGTGLPVVLTTGRWAMLAKILSHVLMTSAQSSGFNSLTKPYNTTGLVAQLLQKPSTLHIVEEQVGRSRTMMISDSDSAPRLKQNRSYSTRRYQCGQCTLLSVLHLAGRSTG